MLGQMMFVVLEPPNLRLTSFVCSTKPEIGSRLISCARMAVRMDISDWYWTCHPRPRSHRSDSRPRTPEVNTMQFGQLMMAASGLSGSFRATHFLMRDLYPHNTR